MYLISHRPFISYSSENSRSLNRYMNSVETDTTKNVKQSTTDMEGTSVSRVSFCRLAVGGTVIAWTASCIQGVVKSFISLSLRLSSWTSPLLLQTIFCVSHLIKLSVCLSVSVPPSLTSLSTSRSSLFLLTTATLFSSFLPLSPLSPVMLSLSL